MEFLVEFEVEVPAGTPDAEVEQHRRAESAAAAKLAADGHLIRLWRRPLVGDGTTAIGLYRADSEAALALRALRYGDDEHYDVLSAFIKSIRGSDVDAGLYWLARMLTAGDPATVEKVETLTRSEQTPDWVSGACLMVRRRDADAAGLLDERYFMYTEDVDFCAAIRALGKTVLFTPDAAVVHLRGRSAVSAPAATRAAYERSHLAFYQKHHRWAVPLLLAYRWVTGR